MNAGGDFVGSVETNVERGQLRSAMEELHRLRSVFSSVSNGITIADANLPDQPLIYVNPAFERMTGYSSAEACGRNCRYLQGDDRQQPALTQIRAAIREGREVRVVLRNYRKDGTLFWNELYLSPILDLEGRLTHFVGVQNDVTAQIESAQRLDHMARHDALTGLFNRRELMSRLERMLEGRRWTAGTVAVLFFDLNNFKQVNDMLGHDAGDRLLMLVAERMRSGSRQGDILARLGGDEFVVVLEDVGSEAVAVEVMQRLQQSLQESTGVLGEPFRPSASIGLAMYPRDGETADVLLRAADLNMYRAKQREGACGPKKCDPAG